MSTTTTKIYETQIPPEDENSSELSLYILLFCIGTLFFVVLGLLLFMRAKVKEAERRWPEEMKEEASGAGTGSLNDHCD